MINPNKLEKQPVSHVVDIGEVEQVNNLTPAERNGERIRTTYEMDALKDALTETTDPDERDAIRTALGGYETHLKLASVQKSGDSSIPGKSSEAEQSQQDITPEDLIGDMDKRAQRLAQIRDAIQKRQERGPQVMGPDGRLYYQDQIREMNQDAIGGAVDRN